MALRHSPDLVEQLRGLGAPVDAATARSSAPRAGWPASWTPAPRVTGPGTDVDLLGRVAAARRRADAAGQAPGHDGLTDLLVAAGATH